MRMRSRFSRQLPLELKFRGGKRKGAGRKNRSGERGHVKREAFHMLTPVHVTLKVRKDIPSLRKKKLFMAFKNAVIGAWGKGLKIQHYCLLSNHLHLIVEARDHKELESFFRSFCTRLSKQINKGRGEQGRVFKDRYHVHLLKTPRETAHALRYVLTNEHKHLKKNRIPVNPFCSNWCFEEFELLVQRSKNSALSSTTAYSADALDLCQFLLDPPRSWLLKKGWRKGLATHVGFANSSGLAN